MTGAERRMLAQLAKLLRHHHPTHVREAPLRLEVLDAGATVAIGVVVEQQDGDGSVATGVFRDVETGKSYGTSADLHIVARKVRFDVTNPARQALIAAHDALLQHHPDGTGACVPCGQVMPCPIVVDQVKVMSEYGHLDAWEVLGAEQGRHGCTDWIYPYKF